MSPNGHHHESINPEEAPAEQLWGKVTKETERKKYPQHCLHLIVFLIQPLDESLLFGLQTAGRPQPELALHICVYKHAYSVYTM